MTRSLSKSVAAADSLTDDHKNLLVRLMSKGLEYRTTSEQVRSVCAVRCWCATALQGAAVLPGGAVLLGTK